MRLTIDASVVVKWFVPETGHEYSRHLVDDNELHAPDLILLEVFNALWKLTKGASADIGDLSECLDVMRSALTGLTPSAVLVDRAARLASLHRHPIYDCLYLAHAEQNGFPLVTADSRLAKIARRAKVRCLAV